MVTITLFMEKVILGIKIGIYHLVFQKVSVHLAIEGLVAEALGVIKI